MIVRFKGRTQVSNEKGLLHKLALKEGHLDIANELEVIIKMSEKK